MLRRCVPTCTTRLCLRAAVDHRLAFDHVHADRLLHLDVGPGLDGRDHRQGVPVVGRADQDDVEVLLLEHAPGSRRRSPRLLLGLLPLGDDVGGLGEHLSCPRRTATTTSTGATWIRRNRSTLAVPAAADEADAERLLGLAGVSRRPTGRRPVAAADRKSRRFMGEHPEMGGPMGQWKQDSRGVRRAKGKTAAERTPEPRTERSGVSGQPRRRGCTALCLGPGGGRSPRSTSPRSVPLRARL